MKFGTVMQCRFYTAMRMSELQLQATSWINLTKKKKIKQNNPDEIVFTACFHYYKFKTGNINLCYQKAGK